jgi:hypothetical protein
LTQRDEEVPVAGSAGREQEALAREVLVGIEVQVEDKSGSRHLQHVARQQRHAVGGSGGRGAITRNLDGVACGEPADNGSRKNVQVEVLRKADLQRAAADERKRPAGRRVVEQRERPAADGTADNRPAVEERQRANTGGRIDGVAVHEFHGAAVGDRVTAEVGAFELQDRPRGERNSARARAVLQNKSAESLDCDPARYRAVIQDQSATAANRRAKVLFAPGVLLFAARVPAARCSRERGPRLLARRPRHPRSRMCSGACRPRTLRASGSGVDEDTAPLGTASGT